MTCFRPMRIFAVLAVLLCGDAMAQQLNTADLESLQKVVDAYAGAWLTNNADTVMSVFADEPVLSPSGLPYLEGRKAARNFWFPPDSPATRVTDFDMTTLEASGSGNLGFVRGTFRLAFEYDGSKYENYGKFVSILRKGTDGEWKITHHIWDDFPRAE